MLHPFGNFDAQQAHGCSDGVGRGAAQGESQRTAGGVGLGEHGAVVVERVVEFDGVVGIVGD